MILWSISASNIRSNYLSFIPCSQNILTRRVINITTEKLIKRLDYKDINCENIPNTL